MKRGVDSTVFLSLVIRAVSPRGVFVTNLGMTMATGIPAGCFGVGVMSTFIITREHTDMTKVDPCRERVRLLVLKA